MNTRHQPARAGSWLATAAFNTYYRFRLREFGAGECTIDVPFRDEFKRPGGAVSGPVFVAAVDVAIWLAVVTRRGAEETWVTVDLKTAFLRAARREPFTCTARVLKIGRELVYTVAECVRGDGALLTHHTGMSARTPDEPRANGSAASSSCRDNLRVSGPRASRPAARLFTERVVSLWPPLCRRAP